jgi:uncharacterized membrane protein YhiD involved in acid resistance
MIHNYFTVFTWEKAIFYFGAIVFVSGCSVAVCIQPFVQLECHQVQRNITYENPSYRDDPCEDIRYPQLLFLTIEECIFSRRIIAAVLLGGIIGWERRQADRPAGIRTMALVSLGSCLFSICSAFAFLRGPMAWDASRISAAIPSGVGFLGSALIFKQDDQGSHVVRGLTTAASLWLSSAVGIACAGGLFFPAAFSTAITLVLLRFGPRSDDTEEEKEEGDEENEDEVIHLLQKTYNSTSTEHHEGSDVEAQRFLSAVSPPIGFLGAVSPPTGFLGSVSPPTGFLGSVSPPTGLTASQRESQRGQSVRQRPGPSIKE